MNLNNKMIKPGSMIGIIGGGQLGRMMALAAKHAGFQIAVLEPKAGSPAGQLADEEIVADYDDKEGLQRLADLSDVITYEFENIDYEALQWLSERAHVPQGAELIRVTQDRILEKNALRDAGVKVAHYQVIDEAGQLNEAVKELGMPCVLKTARGGYDGKGQSVIRSEGDIAEAASLLHNGPCVLESWLDFEKEISVIITKNPQGESECFPMGENIHIDNILHQTIVPARVENGTESRAVQLAEKVADHLQLVGTLAIEMFLCKDGTLYVNELAPRPHNSGHYTIESCNISQFGQHIRAICSWPLQKVDLLKPAVMVNILGQHVEKTIAQIPLQPNWNIHLYGKKEAKQNRKMGHVTILDKEVEPILQQIDQSGVWTGE